MAACDINSTGTHAFQRSGCSRKHHTVVALYNNAPPVVAHRNQIYYLTFLLVQATEFIGGVVQSSRIMHTNLYLKRLRNLRAAPPSLLPVIGSLDPTSPVQRRSQTSSFPHIITIHGRSCCQSSRLASCFDSSPVLGLMLRIPGCLISAYFGCICSAFGLW